MGIFDMVWGFKSYSDLGSVQVDYDYMNLAFVSKANYTGGSIDANLNTHSWVSAISDPFPVNHNVQFFTVPYSSPSTVMAIKPPQGVKVGFAFSTQELNVSGNPTGRLVNIFYTCSTTTQTIAVYFFDNQVQTIPSGQNGLVVKRGDGTVIFNFATPAMRVLRAATMGLSAQGTSFTVSSSKSYAFCYCNPSSGMIAYTTPVFTDGGNSDRLGFSVFNQTSSTAITVDKLIHYWNEGYAPSSNMDLSPAPAIVIDVTNL